MPEEKQATSKQVATKSRMNSKTMRFSALLIAFGIAALSLPEFTELLIAIAPDQYIGLVPIVIGFVVAILREMTSDPIEGSIFTKPLPEVEK